MAKVLKGTVTSNSMQRTAVVEVVEKRPHKMYRKLIKHSKKYKVDIADATVGIGDIVRIVEIRPISKDKHFKLLDVVTMGGNK